MTEVAMPDMPDEIALCPKCRRHIIHVGWCFACGFKGEGVRYQRKDETTP